MTKIDAINEIIAIDQAEENWTDKEWMEDAKFITQEEYDQHCAEFQKTNRIYMQNQ